MSYFPLCIDLSGKTVYLIGNGPQIKEKTGRLIPFGATLIYKQFFTQTDAKTQPAFVVVGDTPFEEAREIFNLCVGEHIPVNVVDTPELCTFFFPALIARSELTVSVSTAGKSPVIAVGIRRMIEEVIPSRIDEIITWSTSQRENLRQRGIIKKAIFAALRKNHPLSEEEICEMTKNHNQKD